MSLVAFQCSICGHNIDKTSPLDPCGVSIFSNLDKDESQQLEQMFFCHYACFRACLDSGVQEYPNFEDQK